MKNFKTLFLAGGLVVLSWLIIVIPFIHGTEVVYDRMNRLSYLTFIPKTLQLASHCGSEPEGSIRFWSLETGKLDEVIPLGKKQYARPVAVNQEGSMMAVHLLNDGLDCYSIRENKWLWKTKLSWFRDSPEKIAFTADDGKIIAAGVRNIVVFNSKDGTVLRKEKKPLNDYPNLYHIHKRVFLSPSSRYLIVWLEFPIGIEGRRWTHSVVNKWVTIWDIEKKSAVGHWEKPEQGLWSAAFAHDDKEILFGSKDGYIWVWSVEEQRVVEKWKAYSLEVGSLIVSPDNQYVASHGADFGGGGAKVWQYPTRKLVHEFKNIAFNPVEPYPMAFTSDGKYFAIEKVGRLCLYDTQTWEEKWCVLSWPEDKQRKAPNSDRK
jgi:WD40 repeat protein